MDTFHFFAVCLLFSIFIITILFRSFKSVDSNKNLPPQPWKLPLVGHIHLFVGEVPHRALRNISQKLGPIVGLQIGEISSVIISSPSLAKEIMKTHDISFANKSKIPSIDTITYNSVDIVFSQYGDYWRQMRKICVLELLSAKKVRSFQYIREQESLNLVESLATQRLKTINFTEIISSMINTIISRMTIGSRCKDQGLLCELIHGAIELSGGFDLCDIFPSIPLLSLITGTRRKVVNMRNKFDLILDSIITEHIEHRANGDMDEEDIVDVLLRIQDEGSLEFPLNSENIKAVIMDMFIGGSDTTAVTIDWVMSELMKNPTVMKKVQDEIRETLKGKTKIQESDIQELQYLKLVIKETLRLHNPAPFIPRECREDSEIGGFHIPAKTRVIINTWMIFRDPDYWTEPESFIPERFSDSTLNINGSSDFEYLPFGSGRRICPGALLGLANVEFPLAILLYHFNWELPNGLTSNDLDMSEYFGGVIKRKDDLLLIPHPYHIVS